ncbi:MAG: hypothetical protein H7Z14_08360 [Anaerolineae bacterium]|nr:hypothetical protein [Phycisphaerae bacterium]
MADACKLAGLVIVKRMNSFVKGRGARFVAVMASREAWPHECPMIEMYGTMNVSGDMSGVRIMCVATDDDPVMCAWTVPTLRDAFVPLGDVASVLPAVLRERDEVVRRMLAGHRPPITDLGWTWDIPSGRS